LSLLPGGSFGDSDGDVDGNPSRSSAKVAQSDGYSAGRPDHA